MFIGGRSPSTRTRCLQDARKYAGILFGLLGVGEVKRGVVPCRFYTCEFLNVLGILSGSDHFVRPTSVYNTYNVVQTFTIFSLIYYFNDFSLRNLC